MFTFDFRNIACDADCKGCIECYCPFAIDDAPRDTPTTDRLLDLAPLQTPNLSLGERTSPPKPRMWPQIKTVEIPPVRCVVPPTRQTVHQKVSLYHSAEVNQLCISRNIDVCYARNATIIESLLAQSKITKPKTRRRERVERVEAKHDLTYLASSKDSTLSLWRCNVASHKIIANTQLLIDRQTPACWACVVQQADSLRGLTWIPEKCEIPTKSAHWRCKRCDHSFHASVTVAAHCSSCAQ